MDRPALDESIECPDESAVDTQMQEMDDQGPTRFELTEYPRMNSYMLYLLQPA